jgi:hypothetical protein
MFQTQKEYLKSQKEYLKLTKQKLFGKTQHFLLEKVFKHEFDNPIYACNIFNFNRRVEKLCLENDGKYNECYIISLYKYYNIYIIGIDHLDTEYGPYTTDDLIKMFKTTFNKLHFFTDLKLAEKYITNITKLKIQEDAQKQERVANFILNMEEFPAL